MISDINHLFSESQTTLQTTACNEAVLHAIRDSVQIIVEALQRGNKVLLCGNGGSAADAQHFAGELVGRFKAERRALPAMSLTVNTSVLTAIGNDYSFDAIFARQVEAFAVQGDVVIGISTSGTSRNVLAALRAAVQQGAQTIALTGAGGGALEGAVDVVIPIPSEQTPRIQEVLLVIEHIICELVEQAFLDR